VGLVDAELVQVVPGRHVAGPARTGLCGQDDNLGVHQALVYAAAGEVLVVTMPQPAAVALVGDLLALQAKVRGIAGLLIDVAVRDRDELADLGLPIWARWIRAAGAAEQLPGKLDTTVVVGGQRIAPGDYVVMNADGAVAVAKDHVADVVDAAQHRNHTEAAMRSGSRRAS
jgi:4-hydroxy-4-methyl-2-oxoglutarate aldolase